jgi:hypothetical protein
MLKQFAVVTFQHNLLETEHASLLSEAFCDMCVILHAIDKLHGRLLYSLSSQTESFRDVFKQTQQLSTIIVNYKQIVKSPQMDLVRGTFTAINDTPPDFQEKNKELVLRLYENIFPPTVNYNHMEF